MAKRGVQEFVKSVDPKKQIADQQKIIDKQAKQIERLRTSKVPALKAGRPIKSKNGFLRVICSDSHGAYQDKAAVSAFLSDLYALQPKEVIHLGDALDCGGFLSQHGTLGVVPEMAVTFEDDVMAANAFLDGVAKAAPGAPITLIEGNHENRIRRWVAKQTLASAANTEYLLSMFGPAAVMNLEKRGIRFIERDKYYDGLSISGTIKLEPHAIAQHGESHVGQYAMFRRLDRVKRSVFAGHNHRLGVTYGEGVDAHLVSGSTGCLCQIRPLYMLTRCTDWTHGYILQFTDPDSGGFLAVPIPIVDGRSYLSPMLKAMGV